MSIYAWLACEDCKVGVWLGKAIFKEASEQPTYFQIGDTRDGKPLNSENLLLNKVIWKVLADHARHSIRVIVEGDDNDELLGDYIEIGGDQIGDISFEKYLKGWPG